jgi:hypothetical protein
VEDRISELEDEMELKGKIEGMKPYHLQVNG